MQNNQCKIKAKALIFFALPVIFPRYPYDTINLNNHGPGE